MLSYKIPNEPPNPGLCPCHHNTTISQYEMRWCIFYTISVSKVDPYERSTCPTQVVHTHYFQKSPCLMERLPPYSSLPLTLLISSPPAKQWRKILTPKISRPFWWMLGLKYVLIDMWANDKKWNDVFSSSYHKILYLTLLTVCRKTLS
jgi:hypothetical protein